MNKKLYILLGISLATNFALTGYVVGKETNPIPPQRPHIAKMMPEHHDGFMKKAFEKHADEMKAAHKAVVEAFKSGEEAKIREALKNASEIRRKMDEEIQNTMVENFMKMTDEEKSEFIKNFEKKGNKHKAQRRPRKMKGRNGEPGNRPNHPEMQGQGPRPDGDMMPPPPPHGEEDGNMMPPPPPHGEGEMMPPPNGEALPPPEM